MGSRGLSRITAGFAWRRGLRRDWYQVGQLDCGPSAKPAKLRAMPAGELDLLLERLPHHHRFAEIPTALRDWLLPVDWDRQRLWELDLTRRDLKLAELSWHFDLPWWRRDGLWFQVTPRQFLARPEAHPEHADRVTNADLSYQLHVVGRRDRWLILDGIHRLVKAELLGWTDIAVWTLDPGDIAKIARLPTC